MAEEFAGRLRTRLGLERWADAGSGPGWQAAGELWAEVAPASDRIREDGGAEQYRGRLRVRLRPADVDESCRLLWEGRAYAVLATRRDPATPDRMELLIEERLP